MSSLWCAVKLQWIVKKNLSQAQKKDKRRETEREKKDEEGEGLISYLRKWRGEGEEKKVEAKR